MALEIYVVRTKGPGSSNDDYTVMTRRGFEGAIAKVKANKRFVAGERFISVILMTTVDE